MSSQEEENPPPAMTSEDESGNKSDDPNVYVRADGKKVRRVKRSESSEVSASSSMGEVYIRADGKKVRRVKRRKKEATTTTTTDQKEDSKPPAAPKPPLPATRTEQTTEQSAAADDVHVHVHVPTNASTNEQAQVPTADVVDVPSNEQAQETTADDASTNEQDETASSIEYEVPPEEPASSSDVKPVVMIPPPAATRQPTPAISADMLEEEQEEVKHDLPPDTDTAVPPTEELVDSGTSSSEELKEITQEEQQVADDQLHPNTVAQPEEELAATSSTDGELEEDIMSDIMSEPEPFVSPTSSEEQPCIRESISADLSALLGDDVVKATSKKKKKKSNTDPAVVAASMKALDNLMGSENAGDDVAEEDNPWLTTPSFDESIRSNDQSLSSMSAKTSATPNPFQAVFKTMKEEGELESQATPSPSMTPSQDTEPAAPTEQPAVQASQTSFSSAPTEQPPVQSMETSFSASSAGYAPPAYSPPQYAPPESKESADSAEAADKIASAAAQALKLQQAPSVESCDELSASLPRVVETPCHSPQERDRYGTSEQQTFSKSKSAAAPESFQDEPPPSSEPEPEGGPLWEAASLAASEAMSQKAEEKPMSRLPEAIRVKTRSRADVGSSRNAPDLAGVGSMYSAGRLGKSSHNLHQMSPADDAYILSATFAKKRARVVQLLVFGLLGSLLGFLGSFYVQSTCNFAGAEVTVGANSEVFYLHYGLWKYSPIDSAFEGYSYCTHYDGSYTADSPIVPQIAGILALSGGAYALLVVWIYLIFGRAAYNFWLAGIAAALFAGIGQALTYYFFAGDICSRNTCTFGPGASVGIVSTMMWFLLSFEMFYNMPTSVMMTDISPGGAGANLMADLEMDDFSNSMKAYVRRISFAKEEEGDTLPTLNAYNRRKGDNSIGGAMMELNSIKHTASYRPPVYTDTYDL